MGEGAATGFLRYQVPVHQDPTVLLAALGEEGFDATSDYEHAVTTLTIAVHGRRSEERERVRRVLSGVHSSTLGGPELIYGPVRFEDEAGDGPHAVPPGELATARAEAALLEAQEAARQAAQKEAAQSAARAGLAPLVRAAWGVVLLTRAGTVCRAVGVNPTWESGIVVQALGARHLGQAALTVGYPSRRTLRLGAAVDAAHAATAVIFATSGRGRRTAGLASAAVATAFALDGLRRSTAGKRARS